MSPRRGIPFVVSAPSGTGKTTVCRALVERDPGIEFSVSHTTRPMRAGERDRVDYHFVSPETFRRLVEAGAFVEHAEYAGHGYGTSAAALEEPLAQGRDLLLEVEVQGAAQLRERRPDAVFVFLLPPSLEVLEQRLRGRGTDSDDAVNLRLAAAQRELRAVSGFDYVVVNEDLEEAIEALRAIVDAERRGGTEAVRARFGRDAVLRRVGPRLGLGG
ncbi:MAG: guanylate kinase [Myxococcota bacterium]|nr:guanylate kinase [Myxococcota bacterium]